MKLFYKSGACSLASHISLREAGLTFEREAVDTQQKKTEKGRDYLTINPKGYVPALELDNGEVLTEGPAILQYIGDQNPKSGIVPAAGTFERNRVQEWLNFVTSEIHKSFSPLFRPTTPDAYKTIGRELLTRRLSYVAEHLKGKSYLVGDGFTVADAYLFTVLNWSPRINLDLGEWP
ncbi:MAG: glutathione transferase GstA, partial [Deltaproteobacteria bacterium]|nr:glutathione transferase GstA [Deltaproteobacteria bacterium]